MIRVITMGAVMLALFLYVTGNFPDWVYFATRNYIQGDNVMELFREMVKWFAITIIAAMLVITVLRAGGDPSENAIAVGEP